MIRKFRVISTNESKAFFIKTALIVNPETGLVGPQELLNNGLEIVKNVQLEFKIQNMNLQH